MAPHKLHDFRIDKENPENGIKDLIRIIKPTWDLDNVTIGSIIGGYSSKIFCCYAQNTEDKITVRIRNKQENFSEWTTEMETLSITHLADLGHFPEVHALFANGYCYQYIEGKSPINVSTKIGHVTEEMLRAMAKEMAFINSVKLPNIAYKENPYFNKMRKMLEKLPADSKLKNAPTKDMLLNEYSNIEKFMTSQNVPLALAHGDTHPGNVVWNDSEKKLTFVDWEGVSVGFLFQDVAYLIQYFSITDPSISPAMKVTIPENVENKFLKFYFEAWSALKNEKVTDTAFQKFTNDVEILKMKPMLSFITSCTFFPDVLQDFSGDGNSFYKNAMDFYMKLKKKFLKSEKFGE